jgi:hypothetical protein
LNFGAFTVKEELVSRSAKIIIVILIALLGLCICACLGGSMVSTLATGSLVQQLVSSSVGDMETEPSTTHSPEEAGQIARSMVDFTLPPGYQPQSALTFWGVDIVAFDNRESTDPLIFMAEVPPLGGMSRLVLDQFQQANQYTINNEQVSVRTVGETQATIRDQNVTFIIREGVTSDGTVFRQISGAFDGQNGLVFLFIVGTQQSWNEAAIDSFIKSLR